MTSARLTPAGPALALALLLGLAATARPAVAGAPCCSIRGSGGLSLVRTARLQTRGVLALSLGGTYYESNDVSEALGAEAGRYTALRVAGNYGLTPWLELSFDAPAWRAEWSGAPGSGRATGVVNPSAGAKLSLGSARGPLLLALEGRIGLPVERTLAVTDTSGETIVLADGAEQDAEVVLLATADFTETLPLRLHLNVGWASNGDDRGRRIFPDYYPSVAEAGDSRDNDALILRGGVEFPGRTVDLFTEIRADQVNDRDLVAAKENPLMIAPGARVRFAEGWSLTASLGVGISGDDAGTHEFDPHEAYPDWVLNVGVSYGWPLSVADSDGDGIPDYRDLCPLLAEDQDGFEDDDGCPESDNDADGVPDALDAAPLSGEDVDGFEDDDGVPDLDNDGDGIVDERDMCPDEAEDLDGVEDEDGCPD